MLVVGLGGNDGLRGLPPASTRDNLEKIVKAAQAEGAAVLLLGLRMPPNYGPEYTAEFERLYADVAEELDVPLVPFMLEGVAGDPSLNQGDGIHPTTEGQTIVAGTAASGHVNTWSNDGVYESIQEVETKGKNRFNSLEVVWRLEVASGSSVPLFLKAHHSRSRDGDDFDVSLDIEDRHSHVGSGPCELDRQE